MADDTTKQLDPLEKLGANPNWRVKRSTFCKAFINEWTQKKMLWEIDLTAVQSRLLMVHSQQDAAELGKTQNDMRRNYQTIISQLKAAEGLLLDYIKEETEEAMKLKKVLN